jgi:hypothetical protein
MAEDNVKSVWLLHHVHEFDDGHEDVKLIGVFEPQEQAEAAQARVASQPGFRDLPSGFSIDEAVIGRIGWAEGYVTLQPGEG